MSSVDHSCAGAAIGGGVPTRVINNTSLSVNDMQTMSEYSIFLAGSVLFVK